MACKLMCRARLTCVTAPAVFLYDHACGFLDFANSREACFFRRGRVMHVSRFLCSYREMQCFVDRFHMKKNHVCSVGFDINCNTKFALLQTAAAEQCFSFLRSLRYVHLARCSGSTCCVSFSKTLSFTQPLNFLLHMQHTLLRWNGTRRAGCASPALRAMNALILDLKQSR